jgi:anti-sigma-K factor RskA
MPTSSDMNQDISASSSIGRGVSGWWRALAIFLLIVLLLAWAASASMMTQLQAQISHLQARLIDVPQVRHVAVLLDADQQPAMLITHNPKEGMLLVQRLNEVREGREDSMQVWAIIGDQAPRSLGVIGSKYQTLQLPVAEADLQGMTEIAISAENKGGVPAGAGPSLPWLFKGWWVVKSI